MHVVVDCSVWPEFGGHVDVATNPIATHNAIIAHDRVTWARNAVKTTIAHQMVNLHQSDGGTMKSYLSFLGREQTSCSKFGPSSESSVGAADARPTTVRKTATGIRRSRYILCDLYHLELLFIPDFFQFQ